MSLMERPDQPFEGLSKRLGDVATWSTCSAFSCAVKGLLGSAGAALLVKVIGVCLLCLAGTAGCALLASAFDAWLACVGGAF